MRSIPHALAQEYCSRFVFRQKFEHFLSSTGPAGLAALTNYRASHREICLVIVEQTKICEQVIEDLKENKGPIDRLLCSAVANGDVPIIMFRDAMVLEVKNWMVSHSIWYAGNAKSLAQECRKGKLVNEVMRS